jgi:hypothetical protein
MLCSPVDYDILVVGALATVSWMVSPFAHSISAFRQAMLMVQHTVVNTQGTNSLITVNAMDYSSHIQNTI